MTKNSLTYGLSALMSDISEECWCAGWLIGTQDTLPGLCWLAYRTNTPQHWGMGLIAPDEAKTLIDLAEIAGSWADMDGNTYQPSWEHAISWLGELAQPEHGRV